MFRCVHSLAVSDRGERMNAIPEGSRIGPPRSENMPRPSGTVGDCLEAAMDYADRQIGVVPLRPQLIPNDKGKLSPIPLIRWQADGPLRSVEQVQEFWKEHPEAQLAITLEDGLVALDLDLKHLPSGRVPSDAPIPEALPGGYVETTKGGGLHYLFRVREPLPEDRGHRIIQVGGYVDILAAGILVVAPSKFRNAPVGYRVQRDGGTPIYNTLKEALQVCATWLPGALEEKWEKSPPMPRPAGPAQAHTSTLIALLGAEEILRAMEFITTDRTARRFFAEGWLHEDGAVDHSQTEWNLTRGLKEHGFSMEVAWAIVKMSPHTKSPRDRRGAGYFVAHVWERIR